MATLLKTITDSETILMITPDASFPVANGVILIGTEIITYNDNYMGTLYGCVRGAQSSSAAAHTAGAAVALRDYYHAEAGEDASFSALTVTGLTASRAVVSSAGKVLTSSATTAAELAFVNGVTSAIQTQINAKQATLSAVVSAATAGGGTSESVTVAGLLTTSTVHAVTLKTVGANTCYLRSFAVTINGSIDLVLSADPGSGLQVLVSFKA